MQPIPSRYESTLIQFPTVRSSPRPVVSAPTPLFHQPEPITIRLTEVVPEAVGAVAWLTDRAIHINPSYWARLTGAARRQLVCHELAHHLLPCTCHSGRTGSSDLGRAAIRRAEAATDALAAALGSIPNLGAMLAIGGVLSTRDAAWLDGLTCAVADDGNGVA